MGSFDIYTNYNKTAGVSGVVFGANKGVLEVELNEMQEITKHQLRNFIKNIIGNGITDTDKITYTNGEVTIADGCSFIVDGNIINCTGLSVSASDGDTIYLQVWEDTVSFGDTLKVEGNQQESSTVPNWIKDSRGEDETTRRLVLKYTLATSEDQTKTNVEIASIANGAMTLLIGKAKANTNTEVKSVKEWALFAELPYILSRGSAIVYNNEIHILGSGTQHYKWDGSQWVSVSTLPNNDGFSSGGMVVYNNEIHILGGMNGTGGKTTHYKWNGTQWTSVSTLPYGFYQGSAVVLNNEIHILGGNDSGITKHYKWDGSQWVSVSTLPYIFYQGSAVVYNNEIHILGASGNATKHYKWDGSQWVSVSTLPYGFYQGSAVVYNNEIHIFGAKASGNATKHYKWDGTTWVSASELPYAFSDGSAVVLNNEIHIVIKNNNCFVFHDLVDHLFVNDQPVNAENILTKEQLSAITHKELTGTLTAGQTSLTFTNAGITSNTIVDNILTSVYGVTPEDMTISNGSLTLTFDAQASDIGVKVVIR